MPRECQMTYPDEFYLKERLDYVFVIEKGENNFKTQLMSNV